MVGVSYGCGCGRGCGCAERAMGVVDLGFVIYVPVFDLKCFCCCDYTLSTLMLYCDMC
jgi:hypothetical protein